MFADDTQIMTSSNDISIVTETLNKDLENFSNWMISNKLTLNKCKTEYMIIGSRQRLANIQIEPSLIMKIGDMEIKRVKTIKSLGLMIDESLNWYAQVEHITTKVNSGLNILRKLREIVDNNTLIMVFKSIVQPCYDYCAQVWEVWVKHYQTSFNNCKIEPFASSNKTIIITFFLVKTIIFGQMKY